jgi:hypothetical protein
LLKRQSRYSLYEHSEKAPKDLSLDEKITKIQKYICKCLTEKALSQRERIEGEPKQVTPTKHLYLFGATYFKAQPNAWIKPKIKKG